MITLLVTATLVLCALFALVYLLARKLDNYGVVDVAWAYAFALLAAYYALAADGWPVRRALIGSLACLWGLRLGTHLLRRVAGHHPEEDGRYQQLRRDWAANFHGRMFGFFQLQAISVVFLGLPFLLAARNGAVGLHPLELAGAVVWLIALSGEGLADAQLNAYKRDPANRGQVCRRGLWRYSRHPNYFFEWLVWMAFFLFALPAAGGWIAILSPACILWLLLRVTGIPMTEEQAVRSKGEAYRAYQRTTSVFVPWFTRPDPHDRHPA
jgi:steroid 5-alpha reductase family enzyme